MKSYRYRSATPALSGTSLFFFPRSSKEERGGAFFKSASKEEKAGMVSKSPETIAMKAIAVSSIWAERLKNAQALTDQKKRLEALTKLVQEAVGPGFYVRDKTAFLSTDRNYCNYYLARGPDGMNVNFDANLHEASKTYYCQEEDGQFGSRVVLGISALHPMGASYTAMMNQYQQRLAKGMETKGWWGKNHAPSNSEKLQAYLANFNQFFFDLVSYNLHTCKGLIAFKFDGLFVTYPHVTEPEQVAAFKTIEAFYKTKIMGNTGNLIRFKIWLQTVLNDGVIIPNPFALKINQLPGLKLIKGDNPDQHVCVK